MNLNDDVMINVHKKLNAMMLGPNHATGGD